MTEGPFKSYYGIYSRGVVTTVEPLDLPDGTEVTVRPLEPHEIPQEMQTPLEALRKRLLRNPKETGDE